MTRAAWTRILRARSRQVITVLAFRPWLLTAALCLLIDVAGVRGVDLAAQEFRVWEFRAHGFLLWDLGWFGGHSDIGYSVLFPAVGALLGALSATAAAAVCSSWLFGSLVGPPTNPARTWARIWFAVTAAAEVAVGSGPFACAVALGLAAVLAVRARHPVLAALAALATSLFSPLGAAFLLLVAAAWLPTIGWRRTLPLAAATVGLAAPALAGDGGVFPFPATALAGQLAIVAIGLLVTPRHLVVVRRALVLFGLTCVALFVVPNPVGGNVARLGVVLIGPLAAYVLLRARRARVLAVLVGPLLFFQFLPIVGSVASATEQAYAQPRYYQGVVSFLSAHADPAERVEIPLTRGHWESVYAAEQVDLARGWYRQIDVQRNDVLYSPLTALSYRQWLDENAVAYVALPDAPLDEGGKAEATLLAHPPGWLHLVYHDAHWQVWQVQDPTPIATGAAALTSMRANGFTLTASRAGSTLVRVRWSPYWHVDAGPACVAPARDGWTRVVVSAAATVRLSAHISRDSDDRCPSG